MNKIYIVALLLILGIVTACSQEQEAPQEELVKTVNVETEILEPKVFKRYLRLVGTVESLNDVRISAEVSGRIEQYFVEKGRSIGKGEPILKIDDSKLLQERARLEAQTEQAREQYERLQRVFEQDSIGSEIDVINARAAYQQSKSALESVKVDIGNTTVKAPFDAVFEDRMLEVGEMASPGMALVRLIGRDQLKVTAGVPSRFADVVTRGDVAEVWFDFESSDTLSLPITYVAESIDPQARTFKVEIALPPKTEKYKIDMIANVKLRTLQRDEAVVIGEEYVYQKEQGFVVYTAEKNEEGNAIAKEHIVKLGPSYENNIIIESGLEPGQRLITVGSSFLQDNTRIEIVENTNQEMAQKN